MASVPCRIWLPFSVPYPHLDTSASSVVTYRLYHVTMIRPKLKYFQTLPFSFSFKD